MVVIFFMTAKTLSDIRQRQLPYSRESQKFLLGLSTDATTLLELYRHNDNMEVRH